MIIFNDYNRLKFIHNVLISLCIFFFAFVCLCLIKSMRSKKKCSNVYTNNKDEINKSELYDRLSSIANIFWFYLLFYYISKFFFAN